MNKEKDFYLIRYDLETKENMAKICTGEDVAKTLNYVRFLKATNIKIYGVNFEKEFITEVFKDE